MPNGKHEDTRAHKIRDEKTFPAWAIKEVQRLILAGAKVFKKEIVEPLLAEYNALLAEQKDALVLINQHMSGKYTSLDDGLRNLLQAYISERDAANETDATLQAMLANSDKGMVHDEIPALDQETSPIVPKE